MAIAEDHPIKVNGRRIAVLGTTGSGKTTVARRLSQLLGSPHVELDALRWGPNWTETPDDVFRERVSRALAGDSWISDGNYGIARDLVWPRATMAVWLDYPFRVMMGRLLSRTLRRGITREELWNGNRERLRTQFLSRDSLILWAFQTYWKHKRDFKTLFERAEYSHLAVAHLRSTRSTRDWLSSIEPT